MTITVDATYENGLLRPAEPLPFAENEKLRVTVEPQSKPTVSQSDVPIWEKILALTRDIPPEELAKLPTDGASQHDHYIYGTPKRTDLPE